MKLDQILVSFLNYHLKCFECRKFIQPTKQNKNQNGTAYTVNKSKQLLCVTERHSSGLLN